MTELRHLQLVILSIAKDIDELCIKNGIEYSLNGGSAIGAIRHHGFIPWDDDLDIEMFREDYNKLCEIGPKEFKKPYIFQNEYTESGSIRGASKLRNSQTTAMYRHEKRKCYAGYDKGIFIDIFPLDSVLDDPIGQEKKKKKADKWCNAYLTSIDIYFHCQHNRNSRAAKIKEFLRPMLYYPCKWSKTWLHRKYEEACAVGNEKPTEKVAIYCIYNKRTIHHRQDYQDTIMMDFEFMKIPVPKEYDHWLTNAFGDWHQFVKGGSLHGDNSLIFDTNKPYKPLNG